jgi:hypothetical protein
MTVVWVWDTAGGPAGEVSGVAVDPEAAKRAAGKATSETGAKAATVEEARVVLGGWGIETAYERQGRGWTGQVRDGKVEWTRLRRERGAS